MTRFVLAMVAATLALLARPETPADACGAKVSVRAPSMRRVLVARQAAATPVRARQARRPIRTGPVVRSERTLVSTSAAARRPAATENGGGADVADATSTDPADADSAKSAAKPATDESDRVAMAESKVEPKDDLPPPDHGKRRMSAAKSPVLGSVFFEQATGDLSVRAEAKLMGVVRRWKRRGAGELTVEGHCSATGPAAANQKLSEVRAESVKDFLVEHGVDESKIETVGYGFNKPRYKPATHPKNRRAVIRFGGK
jgi:outer membrane protein OmpA-like peptidoglycan-associated protein